MAAKTCRTCGETKPLNEYHAARSNRDGYCNQCKLCRNAEQLERSKSRKGRKINQRSLLKRKFGLTIDDHARLLAEQGGVCAICKCRPRYRLNVDHCHDTGEVRALLCASCNKGLGFFYDNPGLMRQAADYIEEHKNG